MVDSVCSWSGGVPKVEKRGPLFAVHNGDQRQHQNCLGVGLCIDPVPFGFVDV